MDKISVFRSRDDLRQIETTQLASLASLKIKIDRAASQSLAALWALTGGCRDEVR